MIYMIQFFTKLPVTISGYTEEKFRKSFIWIFIPAIVIGLLQAGAYKLMSLWLPIGVAAAVALIAEFIITGGMHLDGLADSLDGLMSGRKGAECRRIMKDPAAGPMGVSSVVFSILIAYAIASANASPLIFVPAQLSAKFSILLLAVIGRDHASSGQGGRVTGSISITALAVNAIFLLFVSAIIGNLKLAFLGVAFTSILVVLVLKWTRRVLGAVTGDIYGFVHELGKIGMLIFLGINRLG